MIMYQTLIAPGTTTAQIVFLMWREEPTIYWEMIPASKNMVKTMIAVKTFLP